ncbi:MAG: geranylgeranyl reductase [Methanoculleus sp. SDB]|nr:MAG: geranylgeranyl reductase [Methanoculleus sp. SDB]
MYDVVVVGAGPCGSAAAGYCAAAGLKTLCIEEHATVGHPVQCAGLLSLQAFAGCGVSRRSVMHEVSGATVITGSGCRIAFDAGETKAVVVDRTALDAEMARRAADAGADLKLKTYAYGMKDRELQVCGVDGHERIPFRMVIAADGPRSPVARMLGMQRPPVLLAGIQAEIPHIMDDSRVELYPDASPDFFGWVIPSGPGRARVGLCGLENVRERFDAFIKAFDPRRIHLVTGAIPLGAMPRTYGPRVLFVGDAAGFAKPTSGGGIYTGVRSARHAADVAVECCNGNSFGESALRDYERRWKADFGQEIALGYRLWQARQRIGPAQMQKLCRALNDPSVTRLIVSQGDMDRPSILVRRLLLKPAVIRACGSLVTTELGKFLTVNKDADFLNK